MCLWLALPAFTLILALEYDRSAAWTSWRVAGCSSGGCGLGKYRLQGAHFLTTELV